MKREELIGIIDSVLGALEKNKQAMSLDLLSTIGHTLGRLEGSTDLRSVLAGALSWTDQEVSQALKTARLVVDLEWQLTQKGLGDQITRILTKVKEDRIVIGILARMLG